MSNPLDINATIVGGTVELHYSSHGEAVNQLAALRRQLAHYERLLIGLADIPAFPQSSAIHDKGMTLRDYFAAQILTGMQLQIGIAEPAAKYIAESAYRVADAMLYVRDHAPRAFTPGAE